MPLRGRARPLLYICVRLEELSASDADAQRATNEAAFLSRAARAWVQRERDSPLSLRVRNLTFSVINVKFGHVVAISREPRMRS